MNTKRNRPWSDWWTWKSPERKIRFGIFGGASRRRGALLNKKSLLERRLPCQYKFQWGFSSDYPPYPDLAAWSDDRFRVADDTPGIRAIAGMADGSFNPLQ